jgi:DNA anti-recombination protein RmuC
MNILFLVIGLLIGASAAWFIQFFRLSSRIVCSSEDFATLKEQQDRQCKNAADIAERGGKLYDKFVSFYELLEEMDRDFTNMSMAFCKAKNQLKDGRGSLVAQVEKLRLLGAKIAKPISRRVLGDSGDETSEGSASEIS